MDSETSMSALSSEKKSKLHVMYPIGTGLVPFMVERGMITLES